MMTSSARRLLIFGAFLVLFGLLHTCEAASARFSFHQLTALRTKSSSGEIISDSKANLLEQHAGLGDVVGPSTSFQLNAYTGGALLLACLCALLANSAGIGGGPFYMPLFVAVLGFNMNAATALSHTVVASGYTPHPHFTGSIFAQLRTDRLVILGRAIRIVSPREKLVIMILGYHEAALPLETFVNATRDVNPDGHCGFRALSLSATGSEDNWKVVLGSMTLYLVDNESLFRDVFLRNGVRVCM